MANMQRMGGIGAGVMQGLQFMRQRESDARQDQALANQTELLDMKRQDHAYQVAEQDRKGRAMAGFQRIMADPELTDAERYSRFAAEHAKDMTPDEHMAIRKNIAPVVSAFGKEAIERAIGTKDLSGIEKVLAIKAPGAKAAWAPDGKNLVVTPLGADSINLDFNGFASAYSINDYLTSQEAKAKASMDQKKAMAELGLKSAQAGYYDRMPQERPSSGGGASSSGRGAGGKQPVDPAAMLPVDTYLERFGIGKDSDPAARARGDDGYGYYMRLHKSNPSAFNSVDGNEMAFRLSRDLMNGQVQRDTKFDPKTMSWNRYVTDTQGGTYKLDPYGIDPRKLRGPDGKPAIEPAIVEKEEVAALGVFSKANPSQYRAAASLAQAKELSDEELLAAADGKPISSNGRSAMLAPAVANVALIIRRRGIEQPGRIKLPSGIPRKPLPDTSGYGAGGSKGTSIAGEVFDNHIANPVVKFFKDSADKARAE